MACRFLLATLLFLALATACHAGMASPLPSDSERVLRLNDAPLQRLQALSFFIGCVLLCAAIVSWLWNYLQRDFPLLPRLTYGMALAGVTVWGLMVIVVLTMISGARELMTPGAWQKHGFTYRLAEDAPVSAEPDPVLRRKLHLEKLRTELLRFAATHGGAFPGESEWAGIAGSLLEVPDGGGLRYAYIPGLSADNTLSLLVYEPELDSEQRFALHTNGDILPYRSSEIAALLARGKRP